MWFEFWLKIQNLRSDKHKYSFVVGSFMSQIFDLLPKYFSYIYVVRTLILFRYVLKVGYCGYIEQASQGVTIK